MSWAEVLAEPDSILGLHVRYIGKTNTTQSDVSYDALAVPKDDSYIGIMAVHKSAAGGGSFADSSPPTSVAERVEHSGASAIMLVSTGIQTTKSDVDAGAFTATGITAANNWSLVFALWIAKFPNKPTGYTVNTGHAKCPDHLYMFDEGSFTISSATNASPVEFTLAANHGWPVGRTVELDLTGFTDTNWTAFNTMMPVVATVTAVNKFTVATDTTSYGAYTSGATGYSLNALDRVGTLDLSLQSAVNQWTTQDLGGDGPSSSIVVDGDGNQAWLSDTSFSIGTNKNCLLVCLVKDNRTTASTSQRWLVSVGTSSSSTNIVGTRVNANLTNAESYKSDATNGAVSVVSDTALPEATSSWHLVVGRFRQDGTTFRMVCSVDGEAVANHGGSDTGTDAWDFNRVCVMDRAYLNSGVEWESYVAMAAVYKDSSDPVNEWDDAFIASLYSDPWQFLNTAPVRPFIAPLTSILSGSSAVSGTGSIS